MASGLTRLRDHDQQRCIPNSHLLPHHTTIHSPVTNQRMAVKQEQKNSYSWNHHHQPQQYDKSRPSSTTTYKLLPQVITPLQLWLESSERTSINTSQSRHPSYDWVAGSGGGGEMRAIFLLRSGQRPSTGTGVFLPRNASAMNSSLPSYNSTGCTPVLLPARVVHALNLKVDDLRLQVSPHELGAKTSSKPGQTDTLTTNHTSTDEQQNENVPPEIFLPEEWTY